MSSKALRWIGVGSESRWKGGCFPAPSTRTSLRMSVPRWSSRVPKLCAGSSAAARRLGRRRLRAPRRANGVLVDGPLLVGESERRPRLAQVPHQVFGQHADERVRPDALVAAVADGAQLEVDRLEAAEVALDYRQALVGRDHLGRAEVITAGAGAHDIDTVQGGFFVDAILFARKAETVVCDVELEVLCDLVFVDHPSDAQTDPVLALECALVAHGRLLDLCKFDLGGVEQLLTLSPALVRQRRVAAADEALAGIVGVRDLGEAGLVEQRHLYRPGLGQGLDLRCPERADPTHAADLSERLDARRGDHAAVTDHHHLVEPKALPQLVDRGDERARIRGVAGKDLDRQGPALDVGHEPVVDLRLAPLLIARIAPFGESATAALDIGRRQVVEREPAG